MFFFSYFGNFIDLIQNFLVNFWILIIIF
jgi:hypothetical protein